MNYFLIILNFFLKKMYNNVDFDLRIFYNNICYFKLIYRLSLNKKNI